MEGEEGEGVGERGGRWKENNGRAGRFARDR